jgi:hypothetical protein
MKHSDFMIGRTFWLGGILWRCTDIGTRTVIAIRTDSHSIVTRGPDGVVERALLREEAEGNGFITGPPYDEGEIVLDERDIQECSPKPTN